jgi:hypothetical protein
MGDFDVSGNRERAAYHEAGYCAACLSFGIEIVSVTIANDTPHLKRGDYRQHADRLDRSRQRSATQVISSSTVTPWAASAGEPRQLGEKRLHQHYEKMCKKS